MEQIKIDLVPNGVMSVAHASQFDVGRSMKFLLTDEGVTYTLAGTEVITLKLRKPDGTDDTISLANTSSSYVEWTTVDGGLDLSGVYLAEITITSGDDVLGTANFLLKVEADPYDGAGVHVVTVGPADICTFDTTLPEPLQSVTVDIVATGGNGTPDSPIPINGYTEANITRCGVNLLNPDTLEKRKVTSSNIRRLSFAPMWLGSGSYTLSFSGQQSIYLCEINNNYATTEITPNMSPYTFTLTERKLIMFRFSVDTIGELLDTNIQLELGNNSDYHPYTGNTYTIAFGQTVYGGVLDVTRGKLTIDTLFKTYNGSEDWRVGNAQSGNYRIILDEVLDNVVYPTSTSEDLDCICNMFVKSNAEDTYRLVNGISYQPNYGLRIYSSTYNTNDITLWKTLLANTPLQVVYKLATPFDIDLTPEVISAVVGTNNVFADCGETTVEYLDEG